MEKKYPNHDGLIKIKRDQNDNILYYETNFIKIELLNKKLTIIERPFGINYLYDFYKINFDKGIIYSVDEEGLYHSYQDFPAIIYLYKSHFEWYEHGHLFRDIIRGPAVINHNNIIFCNKDIKQSFYFEATVIDFYVSKTFFKINYLFFDALIHKYSIKKQYEIKCCVLDDKKDGIEKIFNNLIKLIYYPCTKELINTQHLYIDGKLKYKSNYKNGLGYYFKKNGKLDKIITFDNYQKNQFTYYYNNKQKIYKKIDYEQNEKYKTYRYWKNMLF